MARTPLRSCKRCAKGRPLAALFVVGATLASAALATLATLATDPPLIARWRGGELTLARFHDHYDPQGTALLAGGDRLRTEVAKAVFREIESARALAQGLDRDPAFLTDLAAWRTRQLAGLARSALAPASAPTPEEIAAAWSARAQEILPPVAEVDIDVLFVRCPLRASARPACAERLRGLLARLAQGEPFATVAAEEKERSGPANGSFTQVALGSLMSDLAAAAATLPVGEISGPLPSPNALFALRVLRRGERPLPALAAVEPLVRKFLLVERERTAVADLPLPNGQEDTPESRLAAHAVATGLDHSASFLVDEERQRSWLLADAAFLRDPEQAPRPEAIRAAIAAEPTRWRRAHLELAVVDARGDRATGLATAARAADRLAGSADVAPTFAGLPALEAGVALRTLDAVDLATLDPLLAATAGKLQPGEWGGPVPLAHLDGAKVERPRASSGGATGADYEGLALVLLRSWAPADEAAVATAQRREARAQLGSSIAAFMAQFGEARGVEILVP